MDSLFPCSPLLSCQPLCLHYIYLLLVVLSFWLFSLNPLRHFFPLSGVGWIKKNNDGHGPRFSFGFSLIIINCNPFKRDFSAFCVDIRFLVGGFLWISGSVALGMSGFQGLWLHGPEAKNARMMMMMEKLSHTTAMKKEIKFPAKSKNYIGNKWRHSRRRGWTENETEYQTLPAITTSHLRGLVGIQGRERGLPGLRVLRRGAGDTQRCQTGSRNRRLLKRKLETTVRRHRQHQQKKRKKPKKIK